MQFQPVRTGYALFVDGSPGPKKKTGWAGWGAALMAGESTLYESCGVTAERVSSNAIELEALIQGLAYLLRLGLPAVVTVWTDSMYVATSVAKLPKLGEAGFVDPKGNPVENAERLRFLYDLMYALEMSQRCVIRKLEGHSKKEGPLKTGNDLADKLSKLAAYHGEVFYRDNPQPELTEK